jgi:hypothetical protein
MKNSTINTPKFNTGDLVKIVNYGHLLWDHKNSGFNYHKYFPILKEDDTTYYLDTMPDLAGKLAVVEDISEVQGKFLYSLKILGKSRMSWFNEDQLEGIKTARSIFQKLNNLFR